MSLFIDTSVWSLALRRDSPPKAPEVERLRGALTGGEAIFSTGVVLQELLQGCKGAKAEAQIIRRFQAIPLLNPARNDHVEAARLRNRCRRHGVQVATIDALLAQLCIGRELVMLSTDRDFAQVAKFTPLQLWR